MEQRSPLQPLPLPLLLTQCAHTQVGALPPDDRGDDNEHRALLNHPDELELRSQFYMKSSIGVLAPQHRSPEGILENVLTSPLR